MGYLVTNTAHISNLSTNGHPHETYQAFLQNVSNFVSKLVNFASSCAAHNSNLGMEIVLVGATLVFEPSRRVLVLPPLTTLRYT